MESIIHAYQLRSSDKNCSMWNVVSQMFDSVMCLSDVPGLNKTNLRIETQ